jgi:hypothetical protein
MCFRLCICFCKSYFLFVPEFYKQFMQSDIDVKHEAVSEGLAVAEQLKKLTDGMLCLE